MPNVIFEKTEHLPDYHVVPHEFTPEPDVLQRVDDIWATEKARLGDKLFNGAFFSLLDKDTGAGFFTEYRFWLAQRRDTSLRDELGLLPLAVTGITKCADGLLFGQRNDDAAFWEPMPAGGVDDSALLPDGKIDVIAQLLTELSEEAGLEQDMVASVTPLGLAMDNEMPLADIVIELAINADKALMQERFEKSGSIEHSSIDIVPEGDIGRFLKEKEGRLVATAMPTMQGLQYI